MKSQDEVSKLYIPEEQDVGTSVSDVIVLPTKVVFEKNGFVIFYCGSFSVKGNFAGSIVPGLRYKVSGVVGLYGRVLQITANKIELIEDKDSKAPIIASFIRSNFDGVGEKTGLLIAENYGEDILDEIEKRPKSMAKAIKGLSEKRALSMCDVVTEKRPVLEQILKLRLFGLTEEQASKAYDMFGMTCHDEISNNPYMLIRVEGIGFETCEYLAGKIDIDKMDPMRLLGAALCVLNDTHYVSGNMYMIPMDLKNSVQDMVNADLDKETTDKFPEAYKEALELGRKLDDLVVYKFENNKCMGCGEEDDGARVALKKVFRTEAGIKSEVESFVNAKKAYFDDEKANEKINRLAEKHNIELDDLQKAALRMCFSEPFSIITGGPGTGKTTITGILASHFKEQKISSVFCAPTGRAAKRLSEATGVDAHTIHRLLEVRPVNGDDGFAFGRNSNNPLDARVIVVDEASMVDNFLFLSLLRAVKPDSSVILIGDPNQLPSVGPGNLLADLLECESIPRVELKYVFRQQNESSIAANAYRILNGETLIGNDTDFRIVNAVNEEDALHKLFEFYEKYSDDDMAILSPTKQNALGTSMLNKEIQSIASDPTNTSMPVGSKGMFRDTDRVMQVKNDYNIESFDPVSMETVTGVYNGELGMITKINELNRSIEVLLDDGRKVVYSGKTLEDIDLAYAMTVHKSQGCEFDTVIIALGRMSPKLLNRKLLYTGVTRGKKNVIIIDTYGMLGRMIRSSDTSRRITSLSDFLKIIDHKRGKYIEDN